jgi:hypothetical protein
MAKNQVTMTFAGDAASLDKAAARADKATSGVGDAASKAGKQTESYTGRMAKAAIITTGMANAVEGAAGLVSDLASIQNEAKERAAAHSRALLDVEQAGQDARQATRDLAQATIDLKQSQIDATQAAADVDQAMLDQKQAAIDAQTAQKDYTAAVKEHGKGSVEAQQAAQDLAQAQQDLKQAGIDVKQATLDQTQAVEDGAQAQEDARQAVIDGKTAVLDAADAQREAGLTASGWQSNLSTAASVASGLIGTIGFLTLATDALKLSTITSTAATVASTVAKGATAVASGVATAAQWAWNAAMTANPIGIVIVAIGALVAAIVWIATKTTWFQTAWSAAWGAAKAAFGAVKDFVMVNVRAISSTINTLASIPGRVGGFFRSAASAAGSALGSLVSTVRGIPGRITGALGNLGSLLFNAGKNVIQGLINGITNKFSALKDKLNFVTKLIPDWKGPEDKDRKLLQPAGQAVMEGLVIGIASRISSLRDVLSDVTVTVANMGNQPGGSSALSFAKALRSAIVSAKPGDVLYEDFSWSSGHGGSPYSDAVRFGLADQLKLDYMNIPDMLRKLNSYINAPAAQATTSIQFQASAGAGSLEQLLSQFVAEAIRTKKLQLLVNGNRVVTSR